MQRQSGGDPLLPTLPVLELDDTLAYATLMSMNPTPNHDLDDSLLICFLDLLFGRIITSIMSLQLTQSLQRIYKHP